jgi:hypothetical protein
MSRLFRDCMTAEWLDVDRAEEDDLSGWSGSFAPQ